jgi:valyl-tRNA synthetase
LPEEVGIPLDKDFWNRLQVLAEWNEAGRIAVSGLMKIAPTAFEIQSDQDEVFVCIRNADDREITHALEAFGFVQDPDVLDTWFSSALWPHSTMGWPDATADLAKWYPTSVLMTGRDIITLWVARMVMMGIYNLSGMGVSPMRNQNSSEDKEKIAHGRDAHATVPFHHVAINPTILDGKGERMSKSKGNGVDPVDIIDTHGADALRFTLTTMATETQDVRLPVKKDSQGRNTSDKFDLGRNFCTKLWNAARFVMTNIDSGGVASATPSGSVAGVAEATPPLTSLIDRWIVSRFNRAVDDSNHAIAAYRFDQYAKACYDFFWRDFCDWYVEAAKPALRDPNRSAATAKILAAMLDGALRLMHPVIPFITERLWWKLHPGQKLISAEWPKSQPIDSVAEETFTKLQDLIGAIRNVRNEYKIDPKKPVTVIFSSPENFKSDIETNRELIETLAVCMIAQIGTNLTAPSDSARASAAGVDVFVAGVIDPEAEKNRLAKQKEILNQKISALKSRLANPSYADKAPPHLVQQTRDELAALELELSKLP